MDTLVCHASVMGHTIDPEADKASRIARKLAAATAILCLVTASCTSGASTRDRAVGKSPQEFPAERYLSVVSPLVLMECRRTAQQIGYPVPCPQLLPRGARTRRLHIPELDNQAPRFVGPGGTTTRWSRWASFDLEFPTAGMPSEIVVGHLVISSSPRPLTIDRFIFGPYQRPGRVVLDGRSRVGGVTGTWVRVPPGPNRLSRFTEHVVLVWTIDGHTYGVGFHGLERPSRELGLEVARSITLVPPE
jgi:hypothetical protein